MAKNPKTVTLKSETTAATEEQVEEVVSETVTEEQVAEVTEVTETTEVVEDGEDQPNEAAEETTTEAAFDYSQVADIVHELERYTSIMAPRQAHLANEGIIAQVSLYNAIKLVMQSSGDRFSQGMRLLVEWFAANSTGCTSARYLFRYIASVPMSPASRNEFTRLLNLFTVAGEVKSNLSVIAKSVDVVGSIVGLNEAAQARVLEFFRIN